MVVAGTSAEVMEARGLGPGWLGERAECSRQELAGSEDGAPFLPGLQGGVRHPAHLQHLGVPHVIVVGQLAQIGSLHGVELGFGEVEPHQVFRELNAWFGGMRWDREGSRRGLGLKLGGRRTEARGRRRAERRARRGPSGGWGATCRAHGQKALVGGAARIQVPLSTSRPSGHNAARRQRREVRDAGQAVATRSLPHTHLHTPQHCWGGPGDGGGRALQISVKSQSHWWHAAQVGRRATEGLQMAWKRDLGGHARWWGHAQAAATLDWHASWRLACHWGCSLAHCRRVAVRLASLGAASQRLCLHAAAARRRLAGHGGWTAPRIDLPDSRQTDLAGAVRAVSPAALAAAACALCAPRFSEGAAHRMCAGLQQSGALSQL